MLERSVWLKHRLRNLPTHDFWQVLMEGMTQITGAQYAFVAKRVLCADDAASAAAAAEMPPYGEPGSCLMGLAFYFDDRKGKSALFRDYQYQVYGCPCEWMRHDRVLLIPDGLTALTPDNPNAQGFPIPAEGYLAVPLFHQGRCFAHFGCLWTADGLRDRPGLSWGMLEMFLHALEDQVSARIVEGLGPRDARIPPQTAAATTTTAATATTTTTTTTAAATTTTTTTTTTIAAAATAAAAAAEPVLLPPHNLVTSGVAVRYSLRSYARRLSHELRTPMQGVVGMLDVMYASVIEAIHPDRWQLSDVNELREIIEGLRTSIEVAQGMASPRPNCQRLTICADSSKRAVDAADNMVHAYDFNMEVPLTPSQVQGRDLPDVFGLAREDASRPFEFGAAEQDDDPDRRNAKRRRSSVNSGRESPHKIPHIEAPDSPVPMVVEPDCQTAAGSDHSLEGGLAAKSDDYFSLSAPSSTPFPGTPGLYYDAVGKVVLNSRPLKLRELLHEAVHESLRTGGRPDFTKITETPHGERVIVEVAEAGNIEDERKLVEIEVIVDETLPESMISKFQPFLALDASLII